MLKIDDRVLKGCLVRFCLKDMTYKTFTVSVASLGGAIGGGDAWGNYQSVQKEDVIHYSILKEKGA